MSVVIVWDGSQDRKWSGENEYRELVQLVARKIDFDTGKTLDEIDILVKPVKNPIVSDYFKNLTHITQEKINNNGLNFKDLYQKFKIFIGDIPCFSYGLDSVILQEGCELSGMIYDLKTTFIDATIYFKNAGINVRNYTSGTIFKAFGLELDGNVHCAMHDVNSLSHALLILQKQKDILVQ